MRQLVVAAALAAFVALTGCGGEVKTPLGERGIVKGKVSAGGKPLAKGTVVLTPAEDNKGDEQTGQIDPTGAYVTSVFPGKYKVSVTDNASVPAKYKTAASSDITIDIPSGGKADADIDLK